MEFFSFSSDYTITITSNDYYVWYNLQIKYRPNRLFALKVAINHWTALDWPKSTRTSKRDKEIFVQGLTASYRTEIYTS